MSDANGNWVTINGRHVFIPSGTQQGGSGMASSGSHAGNLAHAKQIKKALAGASKIKGKGSILKQINYIAKHAPAPRGGR